MENANPPASTRPSAAAFRSERAAGVALVVLSAFVFSSAGVFAKSVEADAWGVIFWRGLAAVPFIFAYIALRRRVGAEILRMGAPGLFAAVIMAGGTAAFISAFKLTTVANVTLIYAAAPFAAALLAFVFVRERPHGAVIAGSLLAVGGVAVIFSGSAAGGSLAGDGLALLMTVLMAGVMVVYRRWPGTPAAGPVALSSVLLLPFAWAFGAPLTDSIGDAPLLTVFGLVFAVASVALSEGARRLPSAEAALLSALETPLAPLLAMAALAEVAGARTWIGGGIVLLAVVGAQVCARRPSVRPPG